MPGYSSPDRPLALSILESHAQQQADIDGRSLTDFVAEQAAVGVRALDAMLSNPVGGDVERYRAARDRLAADPAYVFEYRQDQVDASFGQQLETLRAGLSRSHRALGLVDPTKLKVLLQDGSPGTVNVTPDLIVAALQRVQVVAPLSGGIEAYSSSEDRTPTVLVHYGVSNLMLYASHLIVAYGMHETSPGISNPRNLREHPEEYARAVSELESLIRQCESGSPSDEPVTRAAAHYRRLVDAVAAHALSFFVFHELGHLLIADTGRSEEELACDEFAASILGASDDDRAWLGAAMSAQLLSIVLRTSHTEWRSAEYPGASYRFARFADALRFAGARLVPPVDDLLAIPTRMYEQEAFETDTRRLLFFSYAATLLARWG